MIVTPSYQQYHDNLNAMHLSGTTDDAPGPIRPDTLAVPLNIVSRIPVPATRSTIKSTSPSTSRISPSSSTHTSPLITRKRSGTLGEGLTTPTSTYPSPSSTSPSPRIDRDDSSTRRARTRSTPLRPTSTDFSSSSSTKIPVPSKRAPLRSQTGFSPDSNASETYRFPTPSPDLGASSNRSSHLFVDHNPSRDSLNPADLELKLSRSLSSDVPDLHVVDHNIKDEPAPFLVERDSLHGNSVGGNDMGLPSRSDSPVTSINTPLAVATPSSAEVPAVRRRAETMAPTTSSSRNMRNQASTPTPTTAKGRNTQVRQTGSKTSTPVKSSLSTKRRNDASNAPSPSTLTPTPTASTRTTRQSTASRTTTPVTRRLSRGPDSTLARGSPRAASPGALNEFGKITNSPSTTSNLAEFPEAFLVPYIPQQTLPKGVRPDEVPIPAVERRLMRERMAKDGLRDDELVTVWGLDGTPLMVSKASIAGGLPNGITEVQPTKQTSDPTTSPAQPIPHDGLPRRSSSKRSVRRPSNTTEPETTTQPRPQTQTPPVDLPIHLGPPMLDPERSRKPSLTFAHSGYLSPDVPDSPAPFQSDRFVPFDQPLTASRQPSPSQAEVRRKPSLLRKPSVSSRQRSLQSLRERERERGDERDLTTIRLEDLRPSPSPSRGQRQPWEASVVAGPPSGGKAQAPGGKRIRTEPEGHGKKEGCKCVIM